ncbi:MAG: hypothetical protein GY703_20060 [Gammaproteobacteria bacterium]|nr:hypothetical protein [Gammaproteobacteria bacterium]
MCIKRIALTFAALTAFSAACVAESDGYVGKVDYFVPGTNEILIDDINFKLSVPVKILNKAGRQVSLYNIKQGSTVRYKPVGYPDQGHSSRTIYEITLLPQKR